MRERVEVGGGDKKGEREERKGGIKKEKKEGKGKGGRRGGRVNFEEGRKRRETD